MIYLFERYYSDKNLPLSKVLIETAKILARFGNLGRIGLHFAYNIDDGDRDIVTLSGAAINRKNSIVELIDKYIQYFDHKVIEGSFFVKIFNDDLAIFDYNGEIFDLTLHLTPKQFRILQKGLESAGLPSDLYFSHDDWVCIDTDQQDYQ